MKFILFLLIPILSVAQQIDKVDFTEISATVTPHLNSKTIDGTVTASFKVLQNIDAVYLDAIAMLPINNTSDSSTTIEFTEDKVWFYGKFEKGFTYSLSFDYTAAPKKALYFIDDQIWTQGQGKNTSHWLPSIDDMNDKIAFDLIINAPHDKKVISNGVLEKVINPQSIEDSIYKSNKIVPVDFITAITPRTTAWHFDMQQPMSSYLVAFVIGNFKAEERRSASNIPLKLYYNPQDSAKLEPTYRHTTQIFNFLENKIGVGYPWQEYKQVPVRDFLYAGMENTGCTIFSKAFVVDEIGFNDRNYVNVNAHELAHQWFGNLVTETEGTHHWLHEGFATYYALLAEREIFGDDYYYWKLFNTAEQLQALSDDGKGQSLLNPKASSLTFYEKGAWSLHILNELIGEEDFDKAVKNYLSKYQFKNVTTQDFVNEVKAVTMIDVSQWETDWLKQSAFKARQAYESLIKNEFIVRYFELAALKSLPLEDKYAALETVLKEDDNSYLFEEVLIQLNNEPAATTADLYTLAFKSKNKANRRLLSDAFSTVPIAFKPMYEQLLAADSYETIETALGTLIYSFYSDSHQYLEATKNIIGFQDKNVRITWLVYAILIPDYKKDSKKKFISELQSYTGGSYSFEIRENAFKALEALKANGTDVYDKVVIKNVVNASVHHYWRFRDTARALLNTLIDQSTNRALIATMYASLNPFEKEYLQRIGFKISEEKMKGE